MPATIVHALTPLSGVPRIFNSGKYSPPLHPLNTIVMDPDLPFVLAGLAIVAFTVIALAKILVNRRPADAVPPAELARIEERLNRIEQAIDSIAVETERISEGQRFTTKLLAEAPRVAAGPPARPPAG